MIESAVCNLAGDTPEQAELLELTWRILNAISSGDAETYAALSSPDLSCYEDVCPYRIDGLDFHLALIRQTAQKAENQFLRFDMLTPRVQIYGDSGIVTYTRLVTYTADGASRWTTCNETRVFARLKGAWKMVHFHRSLTR